MLSGALDTVIQIIFRAEEYAKLFSAYSGSSTGQAFQGFKKNLIQLYAEVLNFLIRATEFLEKPTWSEMTSHSWFSPPYVPFWHRVGRSLSAGVPTSDCKFKNILDRVDKSEKNIEKDVGLLNLEGDRIGHALVNPNWR